MSPAGMTVDQRERAIFRLLNGGLHESGATAKEVFKQVSEELGDDVTLQAYYKLLDRMVATGRLEVDAGAEPRRYRVAPYLHSGNAVTLDDLYALIDEMRPTEAIARVVAARKYYEERRGTTLAATARALCDEDPRELVERFVLHRCDELRRDVEIWEEDALRDGAFEQRMTVQARELDRLAYRYLGLTRRAVDVKLPVGRGAPSVTVDAGILRAEVRQRVFGERCLMQLDLDTWEGREDWNRQTVSGSDGSTYPSLLQLETAQAFVDDVGSQLLTINNSVACVPRPPAWAGEYGTPYHSVPMHRSAIDDPTNRGMVIAPFMYRYLSPSEYEHMAKSATDVVQWRVDRDVFLGNGKSMGDGRPLATPLVHVRDGTVTPQEREWGHYSRLNEYGEMTREGLKLSRQVLERIVLRGSKAPVFAGATKSTQVQFFSSLVNWYIAHGSKERLGQPIDPDWDTTRAAFIADNEAMSYLLSAIGYDEENWWVSFCVVRPFHSLTEFYNDWKDDSPNYWVEKFQHKRQQELRELEEGSRSSMTWLGACADVEDDDFVWLAENADYASFYVGHTAGDPPPVLPRYEFIEHLRGIPQEEREVRVARNMTLIALGVQKTGISADKDHNYLSSKTLVRIVPFVVYDAHEKCKAIGRQLEREVRSIVVAFLQRLRAGHIAKEGDVALKPVSMRRFVERFGPKADGPPELER